VTASVEHPGCRYILGQGIHLQFSERWRLLWEVPKSRDTREEIVACGWSHFRTIADNQHCLEEVFQTKHFNRPRILPCQYNYPATGHISEGKSAVGQRLNTWITPNCLSRWRVTFMIFHPTATVPDSKIWRKKDSP
jgi:hypothetical protein